ncbi:von Willebrand factor A domain-containing protein 1-like [Gouania willdenowi]|uniref:von Willebrand factor A domain-containing protein 1 n=1 Tax=Gouania willdenowi TaxID=441366 RepID=A0A8C5DPX5_GOUWI|nr:von Willebrand factor A domain-containing protein 1 [Gouania willdenowi]
MKDFLHRLVFLWVTLEWSDLQVTVPDAVSNCCEGDILILLDSSGSVANYEFSQFLLFAAMLLKPFSLGPGHVRVGLLQVGTEPHLDFSLDVHSNQKSLQKAMQHVSQLQGDTNNVAAILVAQRLLSNQQVPKVLLWLTDGVQPGDVNNAISELKAQGVSVLIVSTVHGNFQVLQQAATPPLESHLYSVDIDNIDIITQDLREAIIKIIGAERLRVASRTSHSAVLQWRPVLTARSGHYELWYNSIRRIKPDVRRTLSGDTSRMELTKLEPETTYTAFLRPESNQGLFNTLSVNFTTLPDVLSPAEIYLSDTGPRQILVSWGPLQPALVQRYTVEYGIIPSGSVHSVNLPNSQNSTLLKNLELGSQYLVTVSALHVDGKERAMSVRACTQEALLPALVGLQLTPLGQQHVEEVEVTWRAKEDGLQGYWVSWESQRNRGSTSNPPITSVYLPPHTNSKRLSHLAPISRVCVSPIYNGGRGKGICCTAKTHNNWIS